MKESGSDEMSNQTQGAFPIVGIGASAGGLEALRGLFRAMPEGTGAGFVLVQHLDPTHDSLMAELLTKYARIPVVQVVDGMTVQPNRLHVIPPNAELTIAEGVLYLNAPTEKRGLRMPIDRFFSSLADDQQERAVAVVLSGAGTDGTYGVRLIKARGGMVLAQDPTLSGYDGMPRSAIATGDVDYTLPVEEMPSVLVSYLEHLRNHGDDMQRGKQDQSYMDNILALLIARKDYDFRCYKQGTINRRILRRMGLNHISTLEDYHAKLREDESEMHALSKDLLIGVTSFFRDPEAWDYLTEKVLQKLMARQKKDEVVRVWVPGCATGEEAYSLAMALIEAGEESGSPGNIIVFATDVDREALEVARNGVYAESLVADIEPDRLQRFFSREGDNYQVKKSLREKVIFAPQNLITDPPFSNLQLVSCRNLLIYIEPEYQERLLNLFHFSLRDGGYLFLGSSETVGQGSRLFDPVSKKWRVYRRVADAPAAHVDIPERQGRRKAVTPIGFGSNRRHGSGYGPLTHKLLIEAFSPASVMVDREFRVLYYHGAIRDYIGPAPGDPTDDLLTLAGEGVRGKLRAVLQQAIDSGERCEVTGVLQRRGDRWWLIRVVVTPVPDADEPGGGKLLVSFFDERPADDETQTNLAGEGDESEIVKQLESELLSTREELRSIIEQMETSNEELKASNEEVMSMNEELQSTNEELETSKEELQSLNEELTTLNSQLEDKVHELEETTNDLSNLLVSTEIATLFLDRRFRIRRYTPAIGGLMRLIPSDVGRAVTDITWRFQDDRLLDDATAVLAGRPVDHHEIQSDEAHWYLRRVMPYRTEDGHVEGVVVTFTDITQRKAVELALRQSEFHLRRITDAMPVLISYIDSNLRYRFNNHAYERWFGVEPEVVEGKYLGDVLGQEALELIQPKLDLVLEGTSVKFEDWIPYAKGGERYVSVQYIPDVDEEGRIQGFFALITDLTEKRKTEEQIEHLNWENQQNLDEMRALLDAAPVGIFLGRDKGCKEMLMNRAGAEMLRIPPDVNPSLSGPDMNQLDFRVYHAGKELQPDELPMQLAAREGRAVTGFEERVVFPDNTHIDLLTYAAPLFDSKGEVRGCVGTFADITEMRELKQRYKAATERLRIHIENTPLAILEWDREMKILNWSGSAEKVFGWTADEAVGNSFIALGLVYKDDVPEVESTVRELLDQGIETNRLLNRNCRSDGSVIWCEWFNSIIRDEKGEFVSALSVALDVSERQRLEQELKTHSHQLEEASQRKDIFFAMLGHELRNPLTPIRNVIQILNLRHQQDIDLDWVTSVLDRQTSHLQRMVDDLLDMARIRKGVLSIEKARVDLKSLSLEAISALQPMIEEKGHHLVTAIPELPIEVTGDATRLLQVISNLLSNAVRYTPENGDIKISLSLVEGHRARLDVEDNGNGISSELLPHVFDILNQERAHPERSNAGLGLGLALVKQIVQLHRGEVVAESPGLGQGSRFTVFLPLRDEAQEKEVAKGEGEAAVESRHEALSVLLVDDNPDVLESLRYLLTALGHEVRALDAGSKAVDQVLQEPPDLVLLDLGMPDVDGYEVARRLARLPNRDRFKVIAVTGYAADAQGTQDQENDFDAYLIKPLSLDMLSPYLKKRE